MNLLKPKRVRTLERPFGWMACRILTEGILRQIGLHAKALYLGLCLASDRNGLSYWSDDRLGQHLGLHMDELRTARKELLEQDLVAFDGHVYQVLSLPSVKQKVWKQTPHKVAQPERVAKFLASIKQQLGNG